MKYKLTMFGFSAICEDLEEVNLRLRGIPKERANLESGDCHLIDLENGKQYPIVLKDGKFTPDFENEIKF